MNARKHGLSVPIMADRTLHADALNIARAIAGEGADDAVFREAVIIAQTELELARARQARLEAINMAMGEADNNDPQVEVAEEASSSRAIDGGGTRVAEAFVRALPALQRIDRYERRAYSRRKKALACLRDLQLLSQLAPISNRQARNTSRG